MDHSDKTLFAFLLGAVVGTFTGLLLAPTTGDKTRKKINQTADDVRYDVEDAWEVNAEKLKDLADTVVHALEKYGKKVG